MSLIAKETNQQQKDQLVDRRQKEKDMFINLLQLMNIFSERKQLVSHKDFSSTLASQPKLWFFLETWKKLN